MQGFRVELDGVAAAVRSHPSVTHSTALLIDSHIWSFVTPQHVDKDVVLTAAAAIQPYYAVPTRFMALPSFPYTGCVRELSIISINRRSYVMSVTGRSTSAFYVNWPLNKTSTIAASMSRISERPLPPSSKLRLCLPRRLRDLALAHQPR